MSQSVITFSDLINVQRLGSLGTNTVDTGSDFDFNINGIIVPDPITIAGSYLEGVPSNGASTYRINGQIDWPNIILPIPSNARITSVRLVCNGNMNLQASAIWNVVPPGSTFVGIVVAGGDVQVKAPNSIYTENDFSDMSDVNFLNQASPVGVANLSVTAAVVSQIIDKTWDFGVILPGSLDYITQPQLLTSFTDTQIICRPTNLVGGGCNGSSFIDPVLNVGGTFNIQASCSASIETSLWEMIVEWYIPINFTYDIPNDDTPIRKLGGSSIDASSIGPSFVQGYGQSDDPKATLDEQNIITVEVTSPTSSSPPPLDMTGIESINITFLDDITDPMNPVIVSTPVPPINIITQTPHLLQFIIPNEVFELIFILFILYLQQTPDPDPEFELPIDIDVVGDGTQFLGSVTLGELIVLLENASGVYQLVPGKTNDTYYLRESDDTIDVKIPNPTYKTGYVGG